MKRLAIAAIAAALVAAAPVYACGGPWMGKNLVATPTVKARLRGAYLAAHPEARVGAPLAGHTYYGSYSGTRYAVAIFRSGTTTIFRTDAHGRWRVRTETRGAICTDVVPFELVAMHWWLEHVRGHCFAQPGA